MSGFAPAGMIGRTAEALSTVDQLPVSPGILMPRLVASFPGSIQEIRRRGIRMVGRRGSASHARSRGVEEIVAARLGTDLGARARQRSTDGLLARILRRAGKGASSRAALAAGFRRRRRHGLAAVHPRRGDVGRRRAARASIHERELGGPGADPVRHHRPNSTNTCHRSAAARPSGARVSPNLPPAPTLRLYARALFRSRAATGSPAPRSGPPTPATPTRVSCWHACHRRRVAHKARPVSSSFSRT